MIEPQGRDRKTKKVSWPVYFTTAIKANKVPQAILVVICWDPREAARCRRVISTGHPGFDLYPIASTPARSPAGKTPALTVDGLLEQGEEKGAVKSKIEDLIKVIKARGLELTKDQLNLVTSCADLSQLATWFDQALDAKTTDEIFGAH